MPNTDFSALSQVKGKMNWLPAYGTLPSEAAYKWMFRAAVAPFVLLPLWLLLLALTDTHGNILVSVFILMWVLPLPYFRFSGRRRVLEKHQEGTWYFEAEQRLLVCRDHQQTIAEYVLSEGDKLVAGRFPIRNQQYGRVFLLEYRRPYPHPEVELMAYLYATQQDGQRFLEAAENMAANMNLPLEVSGLP